MCDFSLNNARCRSLTVSLAKENVRLLKAPLLTAYAVPAVTPPVFAAMDVMFTIRP